MALKTVQILMTRKKPTVIPKLKKQAAAESETGRIAHRKQIIGPRSVCTDKTIDEKIV